MMKKGCIIVNVSRGGLVDSQALYDGLENGQLGGLGMDVYENEGEQAAAGRVTSQGNCCI
jgi:D-lactate dehydrogenase